MFIFGEIDCRVHLIKQAELQRKELREVIETCVDRYVEFAREVANMGYEVLCFGVAGSTPQEGSFGQNNEFPAFGTSTQRNEATRTFNILLEEKTKKQGIGFVSIFNILVDEQNVTQTKYYVDGTHLSQRVMPEVVKNIKVFLNLSTVKLFYGPLGNLPYSLQFPLCTYISKLRANTYFIHLSKFSMKRTIMRFFEKFPRIIAIKQVFDWKYRMDRPGAAPHYLKQRIIAAYAKKYALATMVESGTFMGEMVDAMKSTFSTIHSIELDNALYERAVKKYSAEPNIHIHHGDSGNVISQILREIHQPILFWLDGHYSGDGTALAELQTPIYKELKGILEHDVKSHVILIDDARLFVGHDDYPTMEELFTFIKKYRPGVVVESADDIIRVTFE